MSVRTVTLGEIANIFSGFAFKSECFNDEGRGLPLVRIRDVVPGNSSTFYDGDYSPQFLVSDGDLLIGMDGEFNRARWRGGKSLLNQRVCRIRTDPKQLDEQFLYWQLPTLLKKIEDRTPFVTVKHLSASDLRDFQLVLPPLDEQRRIAAILDQADDLRRKRQASLELLKKLILSTFGDLFDKKKSTRAPTAKLGSLCDLVRGSSPRPQGNPRYFGGEVPRLMIADITRDGMYVAPSIDSLTIEGAKKSRAMAAGSVVMAVSGAVGLPAILKIDACIHDGFVGFRRLDQRLTPAFLYYWLLQQMAKNRAKGTGAIWVNLTTHQVKNFDVPLPPMRINVCRSLYQSHYARLDALVVSIQRDVFFGDIRKFSNQTHQLSAAMAV